MLQIPMSLHPDTDDISENTIKMVIHGLHGFTTQGQVNVDDYLQLGKYAYNSSVHCLTKQIPLELDLDYEQPFPVVLIAHHQWLPANESVKTCQGCELVEQSQHMLAVTREQVHDAHNRQMDEVRENQRPFDPATTSGAKVSLDTRMCQPHMPMSTLRDASWYIVSLGHTISPKYVEMSST